MYERGMEGSQDEIQMKERKYAGKMKEWGLKFQEYEERREDKGIQDGLSKK